MIKLVFEPDCTCFWIYNHIGCIYLSLANFSLSSVSSKFCLSECMITNVALESKSDYKIRQCCDYDFYFDFPK